MLLTHILLLEPPYCWKMISSLPEPIKNMQPTHYCLCAERTTLFYANSQYPESSSKTLAIAARTENGFLAHLFLLAGSLSASIIRN